MRNCHNVLEIIGDSKDIGRFMEQAKNEYTGCSGEKDSTSLSLDKFIPYEPQEGDDDPDLSPDAQNSLDRWWNWAMQNWGTPADIMAPYPINNCFTFDTELAPPIPGILGISKQFPGIEFVLTYQSLFSEDDSSVQFGQVSVRNGGIKSQECVKKAIFNVCPQHKPFKA